MLDMTGTSTNSGDVSVTNVVVVNNQPANNTPVITVPRLEPGEGRSFSGSYAIPFNVCSVSDTLTATATDLCGRSTNTTISATCPVLTTPGLALTKTCPATNGLPGGVLVFTGTITNTSNPTLRNFVLVNNQPANNTPVI